MSFNINRIRSNISKYGYAKNNKFEVFVQSPSLFQNSTLRVNGRETSVNDLNNLHRFRIEQVRVPGVSLISSDIHRYSIGPTQKMPYNAQYFDTTFSVLVDRNTDLWDFWYNWVNAIFNFNGQEPSSNNLINGGKVPTYTARYKDDYSSIMMIVMYDDFGNTIKTINLYDAFPSSIKEMPLFWNDSKDLLRLSVSITYSMFTVTGSNFAKNDEQQTTGITQQNNSTTNSLILGTERF